MLLGKKNTFEEEKNVFFSFFLEEREIFLFSEMVPHSFFLLKTKNKGQ